MLSDTVKATGAASWPNGATVVDGKFVPVGGVSLPLPPKTGKAAAKEIEQWAAVWSSPYAGVEAKLTARRELERLTGREWR